MLVRPFVVCAVLRGVKFDEVRPIHWSPYDRAGVVNADP
jgi:hypothetical protein